MSCCELRTFALSTLQREPSETVITSAVPVASAVTSPAATGYESAAVPLTTANADSATSTTATQAVVQSGGAVASTGPAPSTTDKRPSNCVSDGAASAGYTTSAVPVCASSATPIPNGLQTLVAMKVGCAVFAALFACSHAAKVTPVQKVIQLLEGMLAKGKSEKHDEQVQFAAYKQFCDDTTVEKKRAIEEATEKIDIEKADYDALHKAAETSLEDQKPVLPQGMLRRESVTYLVECIEESLGKKAVRNYMPMPPTGDVLQTNAGVTLTKKEVGRRPNTTLLMQTSANPFTPSRKPLLR